MIEKITLYKEVLELEPGSRVFFPLAKLLAAKEPVEAINVLKKGLSRHPDHVEARIFLVELLSAHGGDADLDTELEIVSSILRNYPSFWKIWSAHLAHDATLHDAALAINFFGAGLSGKNITWAEVIAQGLNTLLAEPGDETTPLLPSPAQKPTALQAVVSGLESASADNSNDDTDSENEGEDEGEEEGFSLRTRTMAELLAEQGDLSGAIGIYNEILSDASGDEKTPLEARISELQELLTQTVGGGGVAPPKKTPAVAADADSGKLVSLLESLASRFETRAR